MSIAAPAPPMHTAAPAVGATVCTTTTLDTTNYSVALRAGEQVNYRTGTFRATSALADLSSGQALDSILAELEAIAVSCQMRLPVYLDAHPAAEAAARLTYAASPNLMISPAPATEDDRRTVREMARAPIGETLLIYTDAALERHGTVSGIGWTSFIPGSGVVDVGMAAVNSRSSVSAELLAIREGMDRARKRIGGTSWPSVVHTDCQPAARLVQGARSPSGKFQSVLTEIDALSQKINTRCVWVRGHCQDPGNEFADRLAKLARRNHTYRIDEVTAQRVRQGIREEINEYARSLPANAGRVLPGGTDVRS